MDKKARIRLGVFVAVLLIVVIAFLALPNTNAAQGGKGVSKGEIKALEKDNAKEFNSATRGMKIKNDKIKSNPTDTVAEIMPLHGHVNPVSPSDPFIRENKSVYSFQVQSFVEYPTPFGGGVEFYNRKDGDARFYRPYYFAYENVTGTRTRTVYRSECNNLTITHPLYGGTIQDCTNVFDHNVTENITELVRIDHTTFDLGIGNHTIHLMTYVLPGETVEFIPVWFNMRMPEYATWTSDLNINIEAYWKYDTSSSGITPDNATYKHNMTFQGGAATSVAAAKLGENGSNFDGVDDHGTFGVNVALGTSDFSIAGWMRPQGLGTYRILTSSASDFYFGTALHGASDKPAYWIGQGSSWNIANGVTGSGVAVPNNTWVHIAYVRNATNCTMYQNGTAVAQTTLPSEFDFALGIVRIGSDNAGSFMKGHIDELGVWNRPLTPSEVTNLYNNFTGISYSVAVADTTSPNITFVAPTPSGGTYTNNNNLTINVTAADETGLQNLTIRVFHANHTLFAENTSTVSPNNKTYTLSDGVWLFNATAADTSNNLNHTSTRNVTVDTTTPTASYVTNTDADGSFKSTNTVNVNVTGTDTNFANITIRFYHGNHTIISTNVSTTSPFNITFGGLADGNYRFNATVTDLANNQQKLATRNVTIDTTTPLISYVDSGAGATSANGANVSRSWIFVNVSVTETNEQNITFSLYFTNGTSVNITTFTTAVRTINWTGLSNGYYNYNVSVVDSANNRNTTATRNITLDNIQPAVNVTAPRNISYAFVQTELNATVSDPNVFNCWRSIDGGVTNVSITCGTNVTGLNSGQGSSRWMYAANDSAGNVNQSYVTFFVDSIAPTVQFVTPTPASGNTTVSANVTLNVTANDTNLVNITIRLYNASHFLLRSNTSITSPFTITYTGLTDGSYLLNATAADSLNMNNTETRNFTVTTDTTAPNISFVAPTPQSGALRNNATLTINVSAADAALRNITIRIFHINHTLYAQNTSTVSPNNWTLVLSDGTWLFNASAADTAGNLNETGTRNVSIDTTAPTVSLTEPPDGSQDTDGILRFVFVPNDTNAISNCSLIYQGGTFQTMNTISKGADNVLEIVNVNAQHVLWSDDLQWSVTCRDEFNNQGASVTRHLDTKDDIQGSSGGGGGGGGGSSGGTSQTTVPSSTATANQTKNPVSASASYPLHWNLNSRVPVVITAFNASNGIYVPRQVTFEYDIQGVRIEEDSKLRDDNTTLVVFRVGAKAQPGEHKITYHIQGDQRLSKTMEFSIEGDGLRALEGPDSRMSVLIWVAVGVVVLVVFVLGIAFWSDISRKFGADRRS